MNSANDFDLPPSYIHILKPSTGSAEPSAGLLAPPPSPSVNYRDRKRLSQQLPQLRPVGSYAYRPLESPSVGLAQASQRLTQEAALRAQRDRQHELQLHAHAEVHGASR